MTGEVEGRKPRGDQERNTVIHCHDSMICTCGSVVTLHSYDMCPYQLTLTCASLWMAL